MALSQVNLPVLALIKELQHSELSGLAHANSPVQNCRPVAFHDALLQTIVLIFIHH